MIHAICDFCGEDADRTATLLTMTAFQNFARYHGDKSPYGCEEPTKSFVICSKCREKHNLPNPYSDYKDIDNQKLAYKKCLDNYSKEDITKDNKKKMRPWPTVESRLLL